jgi:hypothetical protein
MTQTSATPPGGVSEAGLNEIVMLSTGSNLQTQPPQGKPKIIATLAPSRKRGLSCCARRYMRRARSFGFTPRPASPLPRLAMMLGYFIPLAG